MIARPVASSAIKVMTAFTAWPYSQLRRRSSQLPGIDVQLDVAWLPGNTQMKKISSAEASAHRAAVLSVLQSVHARQPFVAIAAKIATANSA